MSDATEINPYEAQETWWTGGRLIGLGFVTLAIGISAILLAATLIGE